jgi:tRNA nucleotidyltransferase (CCA-adding enzyme)
MLEPLVQQICQAIAESNGRALVVGGFVRDKLLGIESKDLDIEVYGLPIDVLHAVLAKFGHVMTVGKSFGVLRIKGLDVDFSLPRLDNKISSGHRGFEIVCDPFLDFATAAKRRDLTVNSIGFDPLTQAFFDPHGGAEDLKNKVLRATCPQHFSEDPLRGIRVAQFAARLQMQPDPQLLELCSKLDLSELSKERLYEEFRKLLLKGVAPSMGLQFLKDCTLLRFFPELQDLVGVPQDPKWHPEGDVWVHTLMVLDEAAKLRCDGIDNLALMFGALCHDFGKPAVTEFIDGRYRSLAHDEAGVAIAKNFLSRLSAPYDLVDKVVALVLHHLAPAQFTKGDAKGAAYRRLARSLGNVGLTLEDLVRVARADHLGRTTEEALQGLAPECDAFLQQAAKFLVEQHAPHDVVLGRHLLARGIEPGPEMGRLLQKCREVQDETGWTDPDQILDYLLQP